MKILIITPEPATPLKPRVFRFAQILASHHEVTVASIEEIPGRTVSSPIKTFAQKILQEKSIKSVILKVDWYSSYRWIPKNLLSGFPARVALYNADSLKSQAAKLIERLAPDIVHIDRARTFPLLENHPIPKIVDFTDPVGWLTNRIALESHGLKARLLALEAGRIWQYESRLLLSGVQGICASELAVRVFKRRLGDEIAMQMVPVPMQPKLTDPKPIHLNTGHPRLCFSGNLNYPPNVYGINDFVMKHWRAIRNAIPTASLMIVGSRPTRSVLALQEFEGITLYCNVPDVRSYHFASDISIAPLQTCAGFSNKIVDAATDARLPVIASPMTVIGLPRSIAKQVLIAKTTDDWIYCIQKLREDTAFRETYRNRLLKTIQMELNEDNIRHILEDIYRERIARPSSE